MLATSDGVSEVRALIDEWRQAELKAAEAKARRMTPGQLALAKFIGGLSG